MTTRDPDRRPTAGKYSKLCSGRPSRTTGSEEVSMVDNKKRTGLGRYLSELGILLTVERRKKRLLDLESTFLEEHRHELIPSVPSGPVRQDHVLQYQDMAGWKPLREEMREMVEIDPLHKKLVRDARECFAIADQNEPKPSQRAAVANSFWREFEAIARSMAVDLIGYTSASGDLIFQRKGLLFENAVVLGMEMKAGPISEAPRYAAAKETVRVYAELGHATLELAKWLQERGHAAQPVHPYYGLVLLPVMAARAGLGSPGLHGLLLSKPFGPRQRLSIISTNAGPTPPPRDNPMADIRDFCVTCRKCVRSCPGQAFYDPPIQRENSVIMTHIDNTKCHPYFARFKGCSICLKVCAQMLEECEVTGNSSQAKEAS